MKPVIRATSSIRQDLPLVSVVEAEGDTINPDSLGDDITVHVPAHELMAADTVVTLFLYGTDSQGNVVSHEESLQVDDATVFPLVFVVPSAPVVQLTDSTATFDYQVETFDNTGPHFSPPRDFQVSVPVPLPAPIVQEAQGEWLDPANVDARVGAHVQVNWPGMAANDKLTLTWRGSGTGDHVVHRTIRIVGVQSLVIPKEPHVVGNLGGTVEVSYTVDGAGASSKVRLNVGSGAAAFPAPTLDGASNGYLDPGKVHLGATARLPADLTLQPGDTVRMFFGDSVVEGSPPEFLLLPIQIGRALGTTVELHYVVNRQGVDHTSESLTVQVGRFDEEDTDLSTPAIDQATGNQLDLATFSGNATIRVPNWPLAMAGQYVWLEAHGTANSADKVIVALDAHALTAQEASYGLVDVPLSRAELETLDDGSYIEVKMWAEFEGTPY